LRGRRREFVGARAGRVKTGKVVIPFLTADPLGLLWLQLSDRRAPSGLGLLAHGQAVLAISRRRESRRGSWRAGQRGEEVHDGAAGVLGPVMRIVAAGAGAIAV
jgi:hypothetical protein